MVVGTGTMSNVRPPSDVQVLEHDLLRPRLLERMHDSHARVLLVVAPAGSGKSTLLQQFAATTARPCVHYRPPIGLNSWQGLLTGFRTASLPIGVSGPDWLTLEDLARDLAEFAPAGATISIDDAHVLGGSPFEALFEHLHVLLPPSFQLLLGTRRNLPLNISKLRSEGDLVEVTADDLRFRVWEVGELFTRCFGHPLRPSEAAELARLTEGWAVALHLFHLSTQGKPAVERRRILRSLPGTTRLVREYLLQNALAGLPADLVEFVVATSPLGVMTGSI